jgi:hypothetical protein
MHVWDWVAVGGTLLAVAVVWLLGWLLAQD